MMHYYFEEVALRCKILFTNNSWHKEITHFLEADVGYISQSLI